MTRLLLVLAASSFAAKLEPLVPFEQQYLGPHQQANHPHTERGRASSCAGQCINIETFHCVDAGADVDTLVGKCPGANNIQCCPTPATPVDNGPNTCDHGSGVNGLCEFSACSYNVCGVSFIIVIQLFFIFMCPAHLSSPPAIQV